MDEVRLAAFEVGDQKAARALVLRGLGERWGFVDAARNPDLDDIADHFAAGYFVVARRRDAVVAVGGFLPRSSSCVQIHRMSVAAEHRREGLGSRVLSSLLDEARERGYTRVILETTDSWDDAIAFYLARGFRVFDHRDGDLYFELELELD